MTSLDHEHTLSVVVPVYRGAATRDALITELAPLVASFRTPAGHSARAAEVLLVHDCGPDDSDIVIRRLAAAHDWIRPVLPSRNYGQHAATLAGMASSGGDWVATLDEDGQHDPADIGAMLDRAMSERADVVYAAPVNPPPHGFFRNLASRQAKSSLRWLTGHREASSFHSYRLVLGEIARSVAAYAGSGVYLHVALGWVARRVRTCPVRLRSEGGRRSGYRLRTLLSHYWRMVLTSGTRLLRTVSLLGFVLAILGFGLAVVLISQLWLAQQTGRALNLTVSLDTLRDYLFVTDAAAMVVSALNLLDDQEPGATVIKILASGRARSVAAVVGESARVFRRRPRLSTRPAGSTQVRDLRLGSVVWPQVDTLARTPLPAGLGATQADIAAQVRAGDVRPRC